MIERAKPVALVDSDDLFEYPIPSTERLDSHSYFAFKYRRWRKSEFRQLADLEVRAVFIELLCESQDEAPVGTLPLDERLLVKASGETMEVWKRLCDRAIGPLYKWERCRCDNGQIRLYHPVVLETVKEALGFREDYLDRKATERERKRLKALPDQIIRAGGTARMGQDQELLIKFDQYLEDHFPGRQRRPNVVREALEAMEIKRQL